ncbi:unnamed protein product [Prorocentrum cordatum]|uniref:DNA helicase n=1 Tax=Prorocentrum cordatum TaxID=2364126 RepID=A0ABN9PKZ7_9DINO|nr:unnamed protein product [Polarella glacialis]
MVWTEFNSRLRPFGPRWRTGLTKDEYMKDDMMAQGVRLTMKDQARVYYMFDRYMTMKHSFRQYDDIDVAACIRDAIAAFPKVDKLYVDEVQDFSPSQLMVLLSTCWDPDGVTMAGDTCQTINAGSAFSFKDIMIAFREGFAERSCYDAASKAQLRFLHYNYRCAAGVAFWANSVTSLLLERFPHCADRIEEETLCQQLVELPLIVHLEGLADYGDALNGTGMRRQVALDMQAATILVRSNEMREQLHREGVEGTILTIPEAKGLEFDLVVICGLFSSSLNSDMLGALADDDSEESQLAAFAADDGPGQGAFLQLNAAFYALTSAIHELKLLYTGITRARSGCVLLECCPRRDSWLRLVHRWQQANLVEWIDDAEAYRVCSESDCRSRVRCAGSPSARCQSADVEKAGSASSSSSSEVSLGPAEISMREWLEAELEARTGRVHQKARKVACGTLDQAVARTSAGSWLFVLDLHDC